MIVFKRYITTVLFIILSTSFANAQDTSINVKSEFISLAHLCISGLEGKKIEGVEFAQIGYKKFGRSYRKRDNNTTGFTLPTFMNASIGYKRKKITCNLSANAHEAYGGYEYIESFFNVMKRSGYKRVLNKEKTSYDSFSGQVVYDGRRFFLRKGNIVLQAVAHELNKGNRSKTRIEVQREK